MINKISLNRNDLVKIQAVLQNFPEIEQFDLIIDNSSKIGYTLYLRITTVVNKMNAVINIPIVDERDW